MRSPDGAVRPVPRRAARLHLGSWPGYAAAAWGVLFAIPSFVWATGNTVGARSTVSPTLVELARDGVPWFLTVLVVTGLLKLFGALVGIGLTRSWGARISRFLVLCGGGAAVLLTWHGGLFVVRGALVEAGAIAVEPDLAALTRWYCYLWGPWFIAGGLAFAGATALHVRHHDDRRELRRYGAVGALGALVLSVASTATGIG
ncbi:DUF3995 domain-containing protein [Goodfellowiella coeruleoviolacea]|uniref:DUF3995 domain-containing protein n=1 Tax=Goodfellowiella coeruleoviolacea TaxID=334858 RepID=A0AAE3KG97_9PSEU|nr:DUF3995 domain-containing protein [Goodfellowiella coeruleoviolacea]MCP2165905.1 Protein of unknown function (DUF3995) [Goodfellowiella coeruleoviolacea]